MKHVVTHVFLSAVFLVLPLEVPGAEAVIHHSYLTKTPAVDGPRGGGRIVRCLEAGGMLWTEGNGDTALTGSRLAGPGSGPPDTSYTYADLGIPPEKGGVYSLSVIQWAPDILIMIIELLNGITDRVVEKDSSWIACFLMQRHVLQPLKNGLQLLRGEDLVRDDNEECSWCKTRSDEEWNTDSCLQAAYLCGSAGLWCFPDGTPRGIRLVYHRYESRRVEDTGQCAPMFHLAEKKLVSYTLETAGKPCLKKTAEQDVISVPDDILMPLIMSRPLLFTTVPPGWRY